MSDEMMENTETSNPFKMLSDDPVLHILSYLPVNDLLRLTTVDQNFKRIITESHETMKKIRLVLNFGYDLDLDEAIKLVKCRRFTSLRLNHVYKLIDPQATVKFFTLLQMLSESVDDFAVLGHESQELLPAIITMLLPRLKKCSFKFVTFNATPSNEGIGQRSNIITHPLESLELLESRSSQVLPLFVGCNQLKTFDYKRYGSSATAEDIVQLNNLLATQERLEKLVYDVAGLEWDRLKCFQLREITVTCWSYNDQIAAEKFIKKLPHLTKLDMCAVIQPYCCLMKAICCAPKLKKLAISAWDYMDDDDDDEAQQRFVNCTVKELDLHDGSGITSELLKIFLGVESIYLSVGSNELDLSDVSIEKIEMLKCKSEFWEGFAVKFSPSELTTSVKSFQSALMKFAEEFSYGIIGIEIGHATWYNRRSIRVSNSFCKWLVNHLPNLRKLEIYNIADRGEFLSFLEDNQGRLKLKDVKLHLSRCVKDPMLKKMKIQID